MAPAEIRIRDYAENLFLFLRELNGRDFTIGFSEHERVRRLLARLAAEGRIPDDLGALKPYLAAVVCTTRAQQQEFYRRYERWAARFAPDDGETGGTMPPETDPVEEFEKLGFRFRKWIPIFICVAVLLVFGTVVWLATDFGGSEKPVAGDTVAVPGATPSEPLQPTPTENRPQPAATNPPMVENTGPGVQAGPRETLPNPLVSAAVLLCLVLILALAIRNAWWHFIVRKYTRDPLKPLPVHVPVNLPELFPSVAMARAAREFRRHARTRSTELNVPATVDRTIRNFGFFSPVAGVRHVMPEYLVLIDRAAFMDHQASYVHSLTKSIEENGVFIKRCYFDRDPRRCLPEKGEARFLSLADLAARYPEHRLIVFSDGAGFLNRFSGRPADWVEKLFRWEKQALLLFDAKSSRTFENHPLNDLDFIVMPASDRGLAALIAHMENSPDAEIVASGAGRQIPDFVRENEAEWLDHLEPVPERARKLVSVLKQYFLAEDDSAGWFWFCACAVYPEMGYALTLHLGESLREENGEKLFAARRLLDMVRLPWFRHASMPDWLRKRLIGEMTGPREKQVRELLMVLLNSPEKMAFPGAATVRTPERFPGLASRIFKALAGFRGRKLDPESPLNDHIFFTFMVHPLALRISRAARKALERLAASREDETGPRDKKIDPAGKTRLEEADSAYRKIVALTNDRDWAKARSVLNEKKSELAESLDSVRFGYLKELEKFWDRMDKAEDLASQSDKASLEKAENEFMEAEKIAALLPPDIVLLKGVRKRIDEIRKQITALTPESRFVKNPDGTIRDNKLNLDWWPRDNGKAISYHQALEEIAVMNTREKNGKWELPTMDELYSLYDKNAPRRDVDCGLYVKMATDMIHVTCWWFWASDKSASGSRFGAVSLVDGTRDFLHPSYSYGSRFLPVRRGN